MIFTQFLQNIIKFNINKPKMAESDQPIVKKLFLVGPKSGKTDFAFMATFGKERRHDIEFSSATSVSTVKIETYTGS